MSGRIEERLTERGIILPEVAAPAGNYVAAMEAGGLLFLSGQLPMMHGKLFCSGRVGEQVTLGEAVDAARTCGLNLLAQARATLDGNLDRVKRVVKIGGFVACGADFKDHPKVINGVSDLMVEVFGDAGRHARFAVGAPALPLGAPVEVEAIFEVHR